MSDAAPTEPPARHVNVTALLAEAAGKSGVVWVEVPGDRAYAVWHVWHDDAFLVVSGPGEQHLPWLPEEVVVALRSKDSGGRLLRTHARAVVLDPGSEEWTAAAELLRGERLNATGDVLARWAAEGTIHRLTPFGAPAETFLEPDGGDGRVRPGHASATTGGWRPWHLRGRPQRRRRQRG